MWTLARMANRKGLSRIGKGLRFPLPISLLFFAAGSIHLAAETTSIIRGAVLDPQGLAITGAEIALSTLMLASETKVTSDATGRYRIPGLPAGAYQPASVQTWFTTQVLSLEGVAALHA